MLEDNRRDFNILNYFTLGDSAKWNMAQGYFTTTPPEIHDWEAAYGEVLETNLILQ